MEIIHILRYVSKMTLKTKIQDKITIIPLDTKRSFDISFHSNMDKREKSLTRSY